MDLLIYHPAAHITAPRLGKWMGIAVNRTGRSPERPRTAIRYGTAKSAQYRPSLTTINPRKSLVRYSNRGDQLGLLRQAGIPVPHFTTRANAIPLMDPGRLIARDYLEDRQPTRGQGITFYGPGQEIERQHDLLMAFIPKDRQFRVHVIGGRTRVREVVPNEPELREEPIWNLGQGFTYLLPQTPPPPAVTASAVGALAALRLDFGAVDVVTKNDQPFILEVNTAPGLSDPSLEWYGTNLGRLIGLDPDDMPKWDAVERTTDEDTLP